MLVLKKVPDQSRKIRIGSLLLCFFVVSASLLSACQKHSSTVDSKTAKPKTNNVTEDKLFKGGVIGYSKTSYDEAVKRYVDHGASSQVNSYSLKDILDGAKKATHMNDFEAGKALAQEVLRRDKRSSLAYFFRGQCYYNSIDGSDQAAVADFKKAVELGLDDLTAADAFQYLARIYYEKGELPKAIACLNKSISLSPKQSSSYRFRALMYVDLGQFDKAEADYDKCVSISPTGFLVYFNRAKFYESRKRFKEALQDYDHMITYLSNEKDKVKYQEKLALVYRYKATLYSQLGRHKEAIKEISEAIARGGKRVSEEYMIRGEEYYALGDSQSAVDDFTKAIDLSPGTYSGAYFGRSKAYRKLGKIELAQADEKEAKSIKDAPAEKPIFELKRH